MARTFTQNQQRAIDERGQHILVAASAGSGKTTVLIERLMQRILAGTSVDKFLVVTFTKLAAAEMRARLEVALNDQLRAPNVTPAQRKYLQEQLLLLPSAYISTIDSFALNLIENYYHVIGLDPQFSLMADEAERGLMREEVVAAVLEDFYARDDAAFKRLVANFGSALDDRVLSETILKLADFADARPDGSAWLQSLTAPYAPFEELTRSDFYQKQLLPLLQRDFAELLQSGEDALSWLAPVEALAKSHATVASLVEPLRAIADQLASADWQSLRQQMANLPSGLRLQVASKKMKEEDPDSAATLEAVKPLWAELNGSSGLRTQIWEKYFLLDNAAWRQLQDDARDLTRTLVQVTLAFQDAFAAKKATERQLDFGDLTHLALDILADEPTRATLMAQFDELMIDEYQDVNQLQEALLQALSNGHNMYMVGDVKQSIYGFRQADPSLFTAKYQSFAQSDAAVRIDLAENFRSHDNVTTLTNLIFTQLMDAQLGGVPYVGSAKLIAAANYPAELPAVATLNLVEDLTDDAADNGFEKRQAQYALLAEKIQTLLQEEIYDRRADQMRPVQYSDIAILLRAKSGMIDLLDTLRDAGIPVEASGVGNYLKTLETAMVLNILRILDNPHQDIPLAAVLRSPLVGLDENDLATIRLQDTRHDFWTALQLTTHLPKVTRFLTWYENWRQIAVQQNLNQLIWAIFDETNWLDYVAAMPGGAQRQANLQALAQYARQFETQRQGGLFGFIAYIEQLQKADKDLGEASQEAPAQAVRVMTIHGSKGLEFPIVLLPELDKDFNAMDLRASVLMQKDAGLAFDVLLADGQTVAPTLQKFVVKDALKQQLWAEEMRLLYVALTRAEQQLHLFGTINGRNQQRLQRLAQHASQTHGQFVTLLDRLVAQSYLDWLFLTIPGIAGGLTRVLGPETPNHAKIDIQRIPLAEIQPVQAQQINSSEEVAPLDETLVAKARATLAFEYGNAVATRTAAYQAVSEMKRVFEDPDRLQLAEFDAQAVQELWQKDLPLPAFMSDGQTRPSSAAVGTATHLVLQNWQFGEIATETAIEQVIATLVDSDVLDAGVANLINRQQLLRFLMSEFAQEIGRHRATLQREATFSLLVPANQVYADVADDAPILVHGIIDGYFVDEISRSVTLFDFKTDFIHADRTKAELAQLQQRYAGQLRLYRTALQQQFSGYDVLPARLISLSANQVVLID